MRVNHRGWRWPSCGAADARRRGGGSVLSPTAASASRSLRLGGRCDRDVPSRATCPLACGLPVYLRRALGDRSVQVREFGLTRVLGPGASAVRPVIHMWICMYDAPPVGREHDATGFHVATVGVDRSSPARGSGCQPRWGEDRCVLGGVKVARRRRSEENAAGQLAAFYRGERAGRGTRPGRSTVRARHSKRDRPNEIDGNG